MSQRERAADLLGSGRFPLLAEASYEPTPDPDALFEYSLARHLDGFAALVKQPRPASSALPSE
ncbi:hypothetical protein [Kribbella antibiotica]|uniref:hypothetical protein n=1 Tax=Kribbella antibiotica TaxID=190195 RepID=UPI003B507B51